MSTLHYMSWSCEPRDRIWSCACIKNVEIVPVGPLTYRNRNLCHLACIAWHPIVCFQLVIWNRQNWGFCPADGTTMKQKFGNAGEMLFSSILWTTNGGNFKPSVCAVTLRWQPRTFIYDTVKLVAILGVNASGYLIMVQIISAAICKHSQVTHFAARVMNSLKGHCNDCKLSVGGFTFTITEQWSSRARVHLVSSKKERKIVLCIALGATIRYYGDLNHLCNVVCCHTIFQVFCMQFINICWYFVHVA